MKQFAPSMYASKRDLEKAKAKYHNDRRDIQISPYQADLIQAALVNALDTMSISDTNKEEIELMIDMLDNLDLNEKVDSIGIS